MSNTSYVQASRPSIDPSNPPLSLPQITSPQNQHLAAYATERQANGSLMSPTRRRVFGGRKETDDPTILQGFEHQQQRLQLKETYEKNVQLENRIRRLAFEQQRAQKLTQVANQKAEKLLEARERHQKDLQEKMLLKEQKRREEELKRIKNLQARQLNYEKKVSNVEAIRNSAQKTKQFMAAQEQEGYHRRVMDKAQELNAKKTQAEFIQQQERQFIAYKHQSREVYEQNNAAKYRHEHDKRQQNISLASNKIKQLENVEQYLIDSLGKTQQNQQKALENLHSVVQLCNTQAHVDEQIPLSPKQQQEMIRSAKKNKGGSISVPRRSLLPQDIMITQQDGSQVNTATSRDEQLQ